MSDTMEQQAIAVGKTFVWHEVYGASSSASTDFYTKALGWGIQEMDMGPMGTYKMFTVNGTAVAGCIGTKEMPGMDDVPPHWSTYISIDDLEARTAACEAAGGKVLHGPMDVPTVGRMTLIQDPQGATFWLFKAAM